MGYELELIVLIFWLPQAIFQLLTWLYWWQDKEYRWDRFWSYIKTLDSQKELLFLVVFKFTLLFFSLLNVYIFYLYLVILLVVNGVYLNKLKQKLIRRPVFTNRVINIILLQVSICTVLPVILFNRIDIQNLMVVEEIFLIISLFLASAVTGVLVKIVKKEEINKALEVLAGVKPKVIAITGSYGKTTTKEFVSQILSEKYRVVKTEGSQNTVFGVVRSVIRLVNEETDYFVAEVGAYKKGEIREIARILKPDIGVITGIEPQHLELFGNFENLKNAKFELVESLKPNGTAIFNLNDKYCMALAKRTRKERPDLKVFGYLVLRNSEATKADMVSRISLLGTDRVEFDVLEGKTKTRIIAPLMGVHFVENLTGSILVARKLGLSWNLIKRVCLKIRMPDKTMKVLKMKNQSIVIDDTYNSTPKAFIAALEYLKQYRGRKKAVVTTGIIELGVQSRAIHEELGQAMRSEIDKVYLRNREFVKSLADGLADASGKLEVVDDPINLRSKLVELLDSGYVVLLEGRLPVVLYDVLEKYKDHE